MIWRDHVFNYGPKLYIGKIILENIPLSASKFASYFGIFSIKHDLARSCFQLWPKIANEGRKISRKKTGDN